MKSDPWPEFRKRLLDWYDTNARVLPWRLSPTTTGSSLKSSKAGESVGRPASWKTAADPYHVFVSEAMLQQTQVSTVIPYFLAFIAAFPTVEHLANADVQQVLRLWQGLGYYSRARNLHAAANKIVEDFGANVPAEVDQLLTLPGVGRYTAGAIASIAFNRRAPILDGNVVRVLTRIMAIRRDPRTPAVRDRLWRLAERVLPNDRPGDFNSALMDLGATVCTPRNPACLICPVRSFCRAADRGLQNVIPPPKKRTTNSRHVRLTFCVLRRDGRMLVEQRPPVGRWAGLWQFPTVSAESGPQVDTVDTADTIDTSSSTDATDIYKTATVEQIKAKAAELGLRPTSDQPLVTVEHKLTHRDYVFHAYPAEPIGRSPLKRYRWVTAEEADQLPFSRPQLLIRRALHSMKTG